MTSLTLEQVTGLVNLMAQKEATKHGIAHDMFMIELVPGLRAEMIVDLGKGPTIMAQLQWPDPPPSAPWIMTQVKAVIQLIRRNSRTQYQLVPISFIRTEEEREGKRKKAWKRGSVWEDIEERIPGLIPRERVRVEFESVTRYVDVLTDTVIEKRQSFKKMHTRLDSVGGWLELSMLVNAQHPETNEREPEDSSELDSPAQGENPDVGEVLGGQQVSDTAASSQPVDDWIEPSGDRE